ncbi:hypothetical protein [Psychrobacter ciconiae]|uniref:hypothetical protein n=1 Tax=Psychrobacter ciconiae TaxID=1553449 RepID=UPI001919DD15|nr:hypothetical protein [Psychrobacter ciconiae]
MSNSKDFAKTQAQAASVDDYQKRQLLQRLKQQQQRQILTMMGVMPWIQRGTKTVVMSNVASSLAELTESASHVVPSSIAANDILEASVSAPSVDLAAAQSKTVATENFANSDFDQSFDHSFDNTSGSLDDGIDNANLDTVINEDLTQAEQYANAAEQNPQVAPFALDTVSVGDWVLLVDVEALSDNRAILWRDMIKNLGLTSTAFSFPLCDGMRDKMLAEASLAGHIFNICHNKEDVFVAALTKLPSEISHPNIRPLPTLDDMLTDADAKRIFWQQISTRST